MALYSSLKFRREARPGILYLGIFSLVEVVLTIGEEITPGIREQ